MPDSSFSNGRVMSNSFLEVSDKSCQMKIQWHFAPFHFKIDGIYSSFGLRRLPFRNTGKCIFRNRQYKKQLEKVNKSVFQQKIVLNQERNMYRISSNFYPIFLFSNKISSQNLLHTAYFLHLYHRTFLFKSVTVIEEQN